MSLRLFCSALCGALLAGGAVHATEPVHAAILFENVRIFVDILPHLSASRHRRGIPITG